MIVKGAKLGCLVWGYSVTEGFMGGYGTNDGFFVCFIPNVHPKVNSAGIGKGLHFNWISRRRKI